MEKFFKTIEFCLKNKQYLFKFSPTFLDNILVYLFRKDAKKGPLFAVWDIKDKCDCQCIYCDHWKNPNSHKELDINKKLDVVRHLAKAGVGGLSICGGEPLLVEGIEVVIKEAKRYGLFVNLDTNGSQLYKKAKKLIESGVDSLMISVEAGGQEQHDSIRIHKDLYVKLEKGIDQIRKIRSDQKPYIFLRTLIHKKSYMHLDDFVRYWQGKVDKIIFQPIHHSAQNFLKIPSGFDIEMQDEEEFKQIYLGLIRKYPSLDNVYHRLIPSYFFHFDDIRRKYYSFQGTFLADIDSQGDVYTCTERITKLGNLFEDTLVCLWNSKRASMVRGQRHQMTPCYWQANAMMSIYLSRLLIPGIMKRKEA